MAKAKLFDQKSTVSEQISGSLCVCERCERVGLGILRVRTWGVYSIECTNGISDEKGRVLELLGAVRREPLNRPNGPPIRVVSRDAVVRT